MMVEHMGQAHQENERHILKFHWTRRSISRKPAINDRTIKAGPPTGIYITQMKRMRTLEI
jgi:hypothetical protein